MMKNRWMLALVALLMLVMAIPAFAETAEEVTEEVVYEIKYLDNFDAYADTAAMMNAGWTAGNPGVDGTAAVIELIDIADYVEGGKGVKFFYIPEKADWWSPCLKGTAGYKVAGDGITFWLKNDAAMMMRIEFLSEDYTYQCYWDLSKDDMQPGVHQYFLKWEDLTIKEAGVELEPGEIVFKEEITAISQLLFYGYGPDSMWQAAWQGECYIDSIGFFSTEPF